MDIGMQLDRDMSADGRWLNYDQLAELRRIDRLSAIKLATRNKWQRRKGNTGQMQVLVPIDWLDRAKSRRDRHRDIDSDKGSDNVAVGDSDSALEALRSGVLEVVKPLQDAIAVLEAQLIEANTRADRAEQVTTAERGRADRAEAGWEGERARADDLRAQINELNAKIVVARAEADQALAEERQRADRLNEQVETLSIEVIRAGAAGQDKELAKAERDAALARADAMRDRIEALQEQLVARPEGIDTTEVIRQAEAMVDSLREAHAGEVSALKTERHRLATQIDGFATRADQAEARTDSLRARVDVLQRERDTARAEAQETAETLRLTEEARKARGRWARLRAAWRGV
jgi:hypothetical protein